MTLMDANLRLTKNKAEQGDPTSQNIMAEAYLFGEGVPRCPKKSLRYHMMLTEHDPRELESHGIVSYDAIATEIGDLEFELGNEITAEIWWKFTLDFIDENYAPECREERKDLLELEQKLEEIKLVNYKFT